MRQERTVQVSLFDLFAGHEIGRELKAMSAWLDGHRELLGLVAGDLRRHGVKETGRQGLPAEAVLRCALLKQHRQLSYQELAFHLEDFGVVSGVRPAAVVVEPEKVGAAQDDQRDPRRDLGAGQSGAAGERQAGEAGAWPGGAARQHGDRGAGARAERQQPALGRGPGDGAPAAGGAGVAGSDGVLLARSPARGEEACPRDPIHPRSAATGSAVPGADLKTTRVTLAYLHQAAAQLATRRRGRQPGGRALAGQGCVTISR